MGVAGLSIPGSTGVVVSLFWGPGVVFLLWGPGEANQPKPNALQTLSEPGKDDNCVVVRAMPPRCRGQGLRMNVEARA